MVKDPSDELAEELESWEEHFETEYRFPVEKSENVEDLLDFS